LDSWLPWLNSRWDDGARNALALWREMKVKGFPGRSGVVSQWAQRRCLAEKANQSGLARTPSARVIARLMTTARDDLAKSEAILVAAIEMNVPELVAARTAMGDFQSMIRSKTARKLDGWLETAKNSLVGSFAGGVEKDIDAVRNAIISPWSNGQTEGQITRLKLIKRQMYGRAKLDLLQARSAQRRACTSAKVRQSLLRNITNTRQVAELLIERWPVQSKGQAFFDAVSACMDHMMGRETSVTCAIPS
jgi:transposase